MSGGSRGPAVQNGAPVYTSFTQLDMLENCPRKYFFRYVQGIPDIDKNPYAEFGGKAHDRIEAVYAGKPLDTSGTAGAAASAVLNILPRGPGVFNERLIKMDLDGIPLVGAIDVLDTNGVETIFDVKFKGKSMYGVVKASEELQLVTYAEARRRERGGGPGLINLRHVHGFRPVLDEKLEAKGPFNPEAQTIVVADNVPLDSIKTLWESVADSYGGRLRRAAAAKEAGELEPNLNFCRAYGKVCAYVGRCPVTAGQRMMQRARAIGSEQMGLLSKMMANAGTTAPAAKPAEPIPVVVAPVEKAVPAVRLLDIGAMYNFNPAPGNERVYGSQGILEKLDGRIAEFLVNAGTPQAIRVALATEAIGEMVAPAVGLVLPPDAPLQPPAVQHLPIVEENVTAKKKRGPGRPKKEETQEAPVPAPSVVAVPAGGVTLAAGVSVQGAPLRLEPAASPTFYFGAAPIGIATSTLADYLKIIEAKAIDDLKLDAPDIRLSASEAVKYNRWKAILGQYAKETPLPAGHYVVSGDEREIAVAEALYAPGNTVRRLG